MKRTQIYIPEAMHQSATMVAQRQSEPLAELLRRLIAAGLQEEKKKIRPKPLDPLIKLKITGGPKDLSRDMDKYLYE